MIKRGSVWCVDGESIDLSRIIPVISEMIPNNYQMTYGWARDDAYFWIRIDCALDSPSVLHFDFVDKSCKKVI